MEVDISIQKGINISSKNMLLRRMGYARIFIARHPICIDPGSKKFDGCAPNYWSILNFI